MTRYLVLQKRPGTETYRLYDEQSYDYGSAVELADYLTGMESLGYQYKVAAIEPDEPENYTID